jgi:NTP pyrophosphatase (non-canonical NTP hydrolase)
MEENLTSQTKLQDFDIYQQLAAQTAIFPPECALEYTALGLCSEAGEVAGKIKKCLRGDHDLETVKSQIMYELGDVLWYVAAMCDALQLSMSHTAAANIEKLQKRLKNNTIKGYGDNEHRHNY